MIQSDRFWLIENGLTMLECVGTSYGEMDPDGVIILVVMMMIWRITQSRSCSVWWNRRRYRCRSARWR